MVKLIIGVKGTGKTKTLIEMANAALEKSNGSVVCIEKGVKLRYEVKYQVRLINTNDYLVFDSQSLFGFISGILAGNHDITDIFVDSAFKICGNEADNFDKFLTEVDELAERYSVNIVMTSSIPTEEASDTVKKYL
ncbi:MAG: ATP-binding protein [Ruminococcaceae bacterium]|nr:ATP-binding protein [Oscillospiraceae bacterium]MBO4972242.1 ATP-binding protein [Clostridia bacterium]